MKMPTLAVSVLCLHLAAGCGSDGGGKSCPTLCSEAQAGMCTPIKADCAKFCAAIDALVGPAACGSQKNAYQSCLNSKPAVCETSCGSQEQAVRACYTAYCIKNLGNQDCATLVASF